MPNHLELPDELSYLLEKRDGHDRRKEDRRRKRTIAEQKANAPERERRIQQDRRRKSRRYED